LEIHPLDILTLKVKDRTEVDNLSCIAEDVFILIANEYKILDLLLGLVLYLEIKGGGYCHYLEM